MYKKILCIVGLSLLLPGYQNAYAIETIQLGQVSKNYSPLTPSKKSSVFFYVNTAQKSVVSAEASKYEHKVWRGIAGYSWVRVRVTDADGASHIAKLRIQKKMRSPWKKRLKMQDGVHKKHGQVVVTQYAQDNKHLPGGSYSGQFVITGAGWHDKRYRVGIQAQVSFNIHNTAPVFTSGSNLTIDENIKETGYTAIATDAEGDAVRYSISGGADADAFAIEQTTGKLRFVSVSDYENPGDSDSNNVYQVQIAADDGRKGVAYKSVEITITNLYQPVLHVDFPTPYSGSEYLHNITVAGRLTDALDSNGVPNVQYLRVLSPEDGQYYYVNFYLDNPNRWSVEIPVKYNYGDQIITIEMEDYNGQVHTDTRHLRNHYKLNKSTDMVYDEAHNRVYTYSAAHVVHGGGLVSTFVMAIDLDTKRHWVIASPYNGSGVVIQDIASLELDPANNRMLVADWLGGAVIAVDLDTLHRTELSGPNVGSGPNIVDPTSMVLDRVNNRVFIGENLADRVLEVDLQTGVRTKLTNGGLYSPRGLAYDSANNMLYVLELGKMSAIDVDIGDLVPLFNVSLHDHDIAFDETNNRLLYYAAKLGISDTARAQTVLKEYDPITGTLSTMYEFDDRVYGSHRSYIYLTEDDQGMYVTDIPENSFYYISLLDGKREVNVSGENVGVGADMVFPYDLLYDQSNDRLLVADSAQNLLHSTYNTILDVDLSTSNRRIISGRDIHNQMTGSGIVFSKPSHIHYDPDNNRILVVDGELKAAIYAVDETTGDRTLLSSGPRVEPPGTRGSGPGIRAPIDFTYDPSSQTAYVLVDNYNGPHGVTIIDTVSGDREEIVSDYLLTACAFTVDFARKKAIILGKRYTATYPALLEMPLDLGVQWVNDLTPIWNEVNPPTYCDQHNMVFDLPNKRFFFSGLPVTYHVGSLETNDMTLLGGLSAGDPPDPQSQFPPAKGRGLYPLGTLAIAHDEARNLLYIADGPNSMIHAMDMETGDFVILSAGYH